MQNVQSTLKTQHMWPELILTLIIIHSDVNKSSIYLREWRLEFQSISFIISQFFVVLFILVFVFVVVCLFCYLFFIYFCLKAKCFCVAMAVLELTLKTKWTSGLKLRYLHASQILRLKMWVTMTSQILSFWQTGQCITWSSFSFVKLESC